MSNLPSSRLVARLLMVCLVLGGTVAVPGLSQATEDQPTHTLLLTTSEDKISYDFTVAGELSTTENVDREDTDEVSGRHAQGTVGLNGKDTYKFDGKITSFETNNSDSLVVSLDGEEVDPTEVRDATAEFGEGKSNDQTDSPTPTATATPTPTPTPTSTPTTTPTATSTPIPTTTPAASTVLSITEFGPSAQTAEVDEPAQFNLTVASSAATRREDTVVIRADGHVVDQETVSLQSNSSQSTMFTYQFENTGAKTITAGFGGENESVTVAVVAPTSTPDEPQTAAATSTQAQATPESQSQSHVSTTAETQSSATTVPPETTANASSGSSEGSAGFIAGLDLAGILTVSGVVLLILFVVVTFAIVRKA